uniref:SAM domain-containing protein n=1 Tax=Mycena chlorophos TaxID=658473 RepID=A0ABQ0M017_MYCCL|nr:predicted protein [Mycena chlorophos]
MGSNGKSIGRVSKTRKTGTGSRKSKKKDLGSSLPRKSTKAAKSSTDALRDDKLEMALPAPRPRPKAAFKSKALGATASDAGLLLNFKGQAMSFDDAINASLGIGPDEAREIEAEEKAEKAEQAAAKRQKGKEKEIELSSGGDTDEDSEDDDNNESSSNSSGEGEETIERERYTIRYTVPVGNAAGDLKGLSTDSYASFLSAAAKKMNVSISHLSGLASWIPKSHKPVPTLLADEEDYEGMLEIGSRCNCVLLSLICYQGKKSKKNAKKKPAITVEPQTDKGTALMKAIAAANACEQHEKKVCFVMPDSTHYQLTNEDLVDAASLVIMGKATVDNAIEKLKLEDNIEKISKQATIKKNTGTGAMSGFGMGMGAMGMGGWRPFGMAPWGFPMMGAGWSGFPSSPAPPAASSSAVARPSPVRKRKYPKLAEWLQGLDQDKDHDTESSNYSQYHEVLDENGLTTLEDLLAFESTKEMTDVTKISWGVSNRLLQFAKEDAKKLKKARIE